MLKSRCELESSGFQIIIMLYLHNYAMYDILSQHISKYTQAWIYSWKLKYNIYFFRLSYFNYLFFKRLKLALGFVIFHLNDALKLCCVLLYLCWYRLQSLKNRHVAWRYVQNMCNNYFIKNLFLRKTIVRPTTNATSQLPCHCVVATFTQSRKKK